MSLSSLVDKPLMQNPLAGGGAPQIIDPSVITPRGSITDTRDRTLTDPYEIGGGMLGLASIDGSGGGPLFIPDESRPRSEEDIRKRYEQAVADAAKQRREGFLGQVVLPGEQTFEEFKRFTGNTFFLKRNPNIPESAYGNFDLSNVGGFDNPIIDDASMKGLPKTNQPPMFTTAPNPVLGSGLGDVIPNPGAGIADSFPGNPNRPVVPIQTGGLGDQGLMDRLTSLEQGIGSLQNQIASLFQTQQASDPFGLGGFINTRRY